MAVPEFRCGHLSVEMPSFYRRLTVEIPSEKYLLQIRLSFARVVSMAITRRQKEVLDFLTQFVQQNGYSPSYEEIARGLELSSLATVHKHITNLQTKGLLQRAHNRSRSIDVLPARSPKKAVDRLPLMGR